jgi:zinc and cadmium transporter
VSAWAATLLSVLGVSALPLGGFLLLARGEERVERALQPLVAFAVGALLAGAFLHLIPEAIERLGSGPPVFLGVLGGFIGFFVLEKFLWRGHVHEPRARARGGPPLATLNLVGDGLHNLIDGMVIAAAYVADPALGLTTTLAVVAHEIPQELGDFAVLVYGGMPVRRAIGFNFLSGLVAVAGALLVLAAGNALGAPAALLPVAAGGFIYVAAADLVPELHRTRRLSVSVGQIGLMLLGVALVSVPGWLFE